MFSKNTSTFKSKLFSSIIILLLCSTSQANYIDYSLEDMFFGSKAFTGTFRWVYNEGEFADGTGSFLDDLSIPYYSTVKAYPINTTVELDGFEISLVDSHHDTELDVSVKYASELSPVASVNIDISLSSWTAFDVSLGGTSGKAGFSGGSIVPIIPAIPEFSILTFMSLGLIVLFGVNRRKIKA